MVKSITLTASMRSNLNSLKNISKQMNTTQERLSTGKKVNSAIDNASSYYQARALTNRASDLDALLDAMGQGIQTIQAATQGLTSGVSFLEQASAIATEALAATKIPSKEWFAAQENVTAVASNWAELKAALDSGKAGNIVIYGNIQEEGQINLSAGQNLVGVGYYGIEEPDTGKFSSIDIDLEKLNITQGIVATADDLIISDISIRSITRTDIDSYVVYLGGKSNIILNDIDLMMDNANQVSYDSRNISSNAVYLGNGTLITGNNFIYEKGKSEDKQVLSNALLYGADIRLEGTLNIYMQQTTSRGTNQVSMVLAKDAKLNVVSSIMTVATSHLKLEGNSQVNIVSQNQGLCYGELTLEDNSQINIKAGYDLAGITYNGMNYPLNVNFNSNQAQMNLESSNRLFNNSGNRLTFNAVAGAKFSHNGKVYKTDTDVSDNTMNGNNLPAGFAEEAGEAAPSLDFLDEMVANLQAKAEQGIKGYQTTISSDSSYANQYNKAFEQYDKLINDSSYQGVNLLKKEKLDVVFNETRNNKLTVQGQDMSSAALGLTKAEWTTQGDIANSIQELLAAVNKIRTFQSELGNNYSIIQTRQNFTEALTDVLETGADNLVLADMNEESANYLALQTRQQLATNALSLAANSAQSVLALFG